MLAVVRPSPYLFEFSSNGNRYYRDCYSKLRCASKPYHYCNTRLTLSIDRILMDKVGNCKRKEFPLVAGILLGLGLGGFFDGIALHQILQWHHMASNAGYPPDSMSNLQLNILLDGLFHAMTYVLVAMGLALLWRAAHRTHGWWSGKMLAGTLLMGFGVFNLVEGVIDHQILGLHHVNETVPQEQWIYWDLGFLLWGAVMLMGGWFLLQVGRRESVAAAINSNAGRAYS
jgi:uncharacterized membrane protein